MLEEVVNVAISSVIVNYSLIFIWSRLNNYSIKLLSNRNIVYYLISCILITINYLLMNDFIRPITSTIILSLLCYFILNISIRKSIISTLFSQIIIIFSEFIFALIIILLFGSENIIDNYYGKIFTNIIIVTIALCISKLRYNKIIYQKVVSITNRINKYHLFFIMTILAFIASFLTAFFYYKINVIYLLIFNIFFTIVYFIFVYNYLKANNNYLKVYDKYNMTLNSLKEYEDILSRYRISNHENKNQLLTIRSMVKNKKVASYIDEIVENKIKDNEKLMFDSMVIPEGGLRGLIYSKMLLMKENNIEFDLCVDKVLKTTDLTVISDDLMFNICSIVGVYLDNAIEAVKELKEKYITIEIYLDDTLNIAITNNYEGNIDLDSIDKVGYSTKGGSHGYGLSLVKEIISNNKNISNSRSISDDEFTQEIKVKYKK